MGANYLLTRHEGMYSHCDKDDQKSTVETKQHTVTSETAATLNEVSNLSGAQITENVNACAFCPVLSDLVLGVVNPSLLQDSKIKQVIKEG